MNIMLGVFLWNKHNWSVIKHEYQAVDYPFDEVSESCASEGFMGIVTCACARADKIIFILDGVWFPLDKRYHTGEELSHIVKWDHLLEKTIFYFDGQEIQKEEVVRIIKSKEANRFDRLYREQKKVPLFGLWDRLWPGR